MESLHQSDGKPKILLVVRHADIAIDGQYMPMDVRNVEGTGVMLADVTLSDTNGVQP